MPAVFISYSRRDTEFVKRLHDALVKREYDVWVDFEDIPPSAEWFEEIRAGVRGADGVIYVISPDSVTSEICSRELEHAVEQGKRIVPVVCREPDAAQVPASAASLNWIFMRSGDDFDAGIATLVSALETDLDHVRTHTRLGVAAERWQSADRDKSLLLRGSDLAAAEAWLVAGAGKEPEATQIQREYVLQSRQGATRRQRTVIGGVSIALVVAVVLAIVALVQRSNAIHQRNVAYAGQLDGDAVSKYQTDPELSVLLAVHAVGVSGSAATTAALREALAQSLVRGRYTLSQPEGGDALWNPDRTRLLVTSPGGWARIYRPGTSEAPVALGSAPSSSGESAWDANGDRVIIGGGHPAVYDAASGKLVATIPGTAVHAALTPDGTRAVTVDVHSVGHVFDVASGSEIASFTPRFRAGATAFALSPDGSTVAIGTTESIFGKATRGSIDVWSARSGRLLQSRIEPDLIGSIAFSPDSRMYAFAIAGGASNTAHQSTQSLVIQEAAPGTFVYDVASGRKVLTRPGGASVVAFSPHESATAPLELAYATVGDELGHVYTFATHQDKPLIGATDVIESLAFDDGGAAVVAGSRDDVARVYNTSLGGTPTQVFAGHFDRVIEVGFGVDDKLVATAADDGTVRLWQGPTAAPAVTLPRSSGDVHSKASLTASLGFDGSGNKLLETSFSGAGQVLDGRDLHLLAPLSAPAGQGFVGGLLSRDGRIAATLSYDLVSPQHPVLAGETYNAATGALMATMTPSTPGPLLEGALDFAGDKLVTTGQAGASDLFDARTGKLLHHLPGTNEAVVAAFSHDDSTLAIAHYPALPPPTKVPSNLGPVTIDVWNARTGALERTIQGDPLVPQVAGEPFYAPLSLAFSPDGRMLAVGGADQGIEIYDPDTGKPAIPRPLGLMGVSAGTWAGSVAFSPNGKLLAAGAVSGAYVWRVPSFHALAPFQHVPAGNTFIVGGGVGVQVGFTADSTKLVTSGDLTLEAWNVNDHLQLFHEFPTARGAINPAGNELVAVNGSGVLKFHCDLCGGLQQLLAVAKLRTTRQLTPSEKAQFLTQG